MKFLINHHIILCCKFLMKTFFYKIDFYLFLNIKLYRIEQIRQLKDSQKFDYTLPTV